jgi:hypothetical protein
MVFEKSAETGLAFIHVKCGANEALGTELDVFAGGKEEDENVPHDPVATENVEKSRRRTAFCVVGDCLLEAIPNH